MSWLTKVFSVKNKASVKDKTEKDITPAVNEVKCTPPSAESVSKVRYEQIKHLVPLRHLSEQALSTLSHKILTYEEQAIIFIYKQPVEYIYYLLEGVVTLQPQAKSNYEVSADSLHAHFPISGSKICGATATAKTKVKILAIASDLTQLWTAKSKSDVACVELIDLKLPEVLNSHQFFQGFVEAYQENKLILPSLPAVAFKLKEAMAHNIGVQEAVDIIQLDSAIVTKLIQVANSPLYSPVVPIRNCQDAVTRLGLSATRNIVTEISLKQLFVCKDKHLTGLMQNLWKRSLYVSSLSFVLAEETGIVNPDDALLAGLVSDIGMIPVLHFAEKYPEEYPDIKQLELALPFIRGPVGKLMLHTLGFSDELMSIPHHSEDWLYESNAEISLVDIVILAKLHSYFGSQRARALPYINSIPAYAKIKEGSLSPDLSLNVLRRASQRIKDIMSVLA